MGIMGVLFNPNRRIQANQFWQGIIVLVAIQLVLQVLAVFGVTLGFVGGVLSIAIVYPYLCVFGKRLHDSNKTAWLFLLFVLGHVVIVSVSFFFVPGLGDFFEQYMALAAEADEDALEALALEFSEEAKTSLAVVGIGGLLASNFLLGFLCARLFSDPYTNKYGPPVGGEAEGASDDNDIFS